MELIDDDGNLFGVVNVVDALVVVGVLAIVVAGIAFVDPFGGGGEEAVRYATIEVNEQPAFVAERISAGDVMSPAGTQNNLTVTDVYQTPGQDDDVSVMLRVRAEGTLIEQPQQPGTRFEYAGTELAPGVEYTVTTSQYTVTGRVTDLARQTDTLPTASTSVTVRTVVSETTANAVEVGDTYQLAGESVARIETMHLAPGTNQNTRQLTVGATVQTVARSEQRFAGRPVTLDAQLPFRTDAYALSGTVTAVNNDSVRTTTTNVVTETTVPIQVADSIQPGDTYRIADTTVAQIQSATVYPTSNQTTERVVLGMRIRTTSQDGTRQFGSRPVMIDSTVPFRTDNYQFTSRVQAVGTTEPPGTTATRTIVVKLASVSPELAENLQPGLRERQRRTTTAQVQDVRVEPAVITLTSERGEIFRRQDPVNKDVYLTVTATVRETQSGVTFHGRPFQENTNVVLDLGTVTVSGQVIDIRG